jgi:cation diffusion facilitator CzcD-associated flavoprotein CzcO
VNKPPSVPEQVDAVVVGAGFSGLYMLYRLRQLGLSTRVLEAAGDVGGTWYWNRYPGARCDVPTTDYTYSFDPELEKEWTWSEKYATQPEILDYLRFVADRHGLRPDIEFSTAVTAARWDEQDKRWELSTSGGARISCRYYIMATGCLSVPKQPDIEGAGRFAGPVYFTSRWPHEGVEDGIETADESHLFDAIVYATGFDAMTGALVGVDVTGRDGTSLKEKWAGRPSTYLGLMTTGFPNFFMLTGPGSPSVLSNMAVSIEQHVDWVADCLKDLRDQGLETIEPTAVAEAGWNRHVQDCAAITLHPTANSWYMGANVPGKPRFFLPYIGGVNAYRQACDEVAAQGYLGFRLTGPGGERCRDGVIRSMQPDVAMVLEFIAALGLPPMETLSAGWT